MGISNSLETGKRSLIAQRYTLDVTSNNIANVNTPGYSRKTVTLMETAPRFSNGGLIGTGVVASKVNMFRDRYLDSDVRDNMTKQSMFENDDATIGRIQSVFGEPSDLGLDSTLREFFGTLDSLGSSPENVTRRELLLTASANLSLTFNTLGQKFSEMRTQTLTRVGNSVSGMNDTIRDIANLNASIQIAKPEGGDYGKFVDERQLKLEELSKYAKIQVFHNESGMVGVSINGMAVVSDTIPMKLGTMTTTNSVSGETTLKLTLLDGQNNAVATINPTEGAIASDVRQYNEVFDPIDSSGNLSVHTRLNDLANSLATKINALANTGYGLDDTGVVPAGRNFFEPAPVGQKVTALTLKLSADIAGKPRDIPFSSLSGESGNAVIGTQMSALSTDTTFLKNMTPTQFYSSILADLGTQQRNASNNLQVAGLLGEQLNNQREAIVGVNLDEEAINLVRFQKAYDASARIIQTASEMLDTLINVVR